VRRRTLFGLLALAACGADTGHWNGALAGFRPGPVPAEYHRGEVLFNSYCSSCHGLNGTGQGLGPALLDTLYLPAVLPDSAVARAIQQGARQRHWNFGAMPPVKRVEPGETALIIEYLRWLQRRAGLIDTVASAPETT